MAGVVSRTSVASHSLSSLLLDAGVAGHNEAPSPIAAQAADGTPQADSSTGLRAVVGLCSQESVSGRRAAACHPCKRFIW